MKRKIYTILFACILLGFVSNQVRAQVFKVGDLWYTVIDNDAKKVKVVPQNWPVQTYDSGQKPSGDVVVPATIVHPENSDVYTVAKIGEQAFRSNNVITSLLLPNTIESVDTNAIRQNSELLSVEFEAGGTVSTIIKRSGLAENAKLNHLVLPEGLAIVQTYGLNGLTALEALTLPASLTTVYEMGFHGDKNHSVLTDVICLSENPPEIVKENGSVSSSGNIFGSLELNIKLTLTVPPGASKNYDKVTPWSNFKEIIEANDEELPEEDVFKVGQLYYTVTDVINKNVKVVPENWPYISYDEANFPAGAIEIPRSITHPEDGQLYHVTEIGRGAFVKDDLLTSILIPNSIEKIDTMAFKECRNLETVTFESGIPITHIHRSVFEYCNSLQSLSLPQHVEYIEQYAFLDCNKLESITFENEIAYFETVAFYDCSALRHVTLKSVYPPGVQSNVFYKASVEEAILYVPIGSLGNYTGPPWASFKEIREVDFTTDSKSAQLNDALKISKSGGGLVIEGLTAADVVEIYDMRGVQYFKDISTGSNLNIHPVPTGIYVIKINESVRKIAI